LAHRACKIARVRTPITVAALAAATIIRAAALPLPGTEDMGVWKIWSFAGSRDVLGMYGVGGDPPERRLLEFRRRYTTVDYPPVALYEMAIAGAIYGRVLPDFPDDWRLNVGVKLPGFLAGIVLTVVLFVGLHRITGSRDVGLWAAAAYWCNPATILNGEVLGYLDPLMLAPAVTSLIALHLGAPIWAGGLFAAALLTKPQALLFGPAFVLAAWHTGGLRRLRLAAAAGAAWLVVGLLPYLLVGAGRNMLLAFGSWQARRDILSGNAANLWWIATWLARAQNLIPLFGVPGAYLQRVHRILAISSWMEMGLPNPRPAGQALVVAATIWAFWRTRRSAHPPVHFALAAFTTQAFFTLGVSVHEHHLMSAVPLMAVAGALDIRFRPVFYTVSGIAALNMNLFYGIGLGWGWAVPRELTGVDLSVILAFVSLAALMWHARVLSKVAG
jgi:hypothetical protein